MKTILKHIEKARDANSLIGLHTDPNSIESFSLGWILDFNDIHYSAATLDEYGRRDSYQIGYIEDVLRLSVSGKYLERMNSFVNTVLKEEMIKTIQVEASISEWLQRNCATGVIVSIVDRHRAITRGLPVEVSQETFLIEEVNNQGIELGRLLVLFDSLHRIEFGGPIENAIHTLHNWTTKMIAR